MKEKKPDQNDYEYLAEFRYRIRCFLEFSETMAKEIGLSSRHHQAILAVKGWEKKGGMGVGDLAERLRIQPHSATELVQRLVAQSLVQKTLHPEDRRRSVLKLTKKAEDLLSQLSARHLEEIQKIREALGEWEKISQSTAGPK